MRSYVMYSQFTIRIRKNKLCKRSIETLQRKKNHLLLMVIKIKYIHQRCVCVFIKMGMKKNHWIKFAWNINNLPYYNSHMVFFAIYSDLTNWRKKTLENIHFKFCWLLLLLCIQGTHTVPTFSDIMLNQNVFLIQKKKHTHTQNWDCRQTLNNETCCIIAYHLMSW